MGDCNDALGPVAARLDDVARGLRDDWTQEAVIGILAATAERCRNASRGHGFVADDEKPLAAMRAVESREAVNG